MEQKIKVALVDDHVLLRHALANLINSSDEYTVTIEASNGKELIAKLNKDAAPDIAILDLNMPVMDGHDTAAWLQQNHPTIHVLMLTMYDSELILIRLLKTGVKGFMKKDIHPTELLFALQSVVEQGYYYSAHTSSKLAGLFLENEDKVPLFQKVMLSDQELEFLKYASTELTYKEIAQKMRMNPRAIDGIRDGLFTRLDVKSRIGLTMYAIKQGLVNF
ncbi:response regulator transcription factor [Pollutibacter soli]|uniref:response regulator transcription factor n=1 Tax=Pollutibacter soli TaxID=3034157 RepID=UPI003013F82B